MASLNVTVTRRAFDAARRGDIAALRAALVLAAQQQQQQQQHQQPGAAASSVTRSAQADVGSSSQSVAAVAAAAPLLLDADGDTLLHAAAAAGHDALIPILIHEAGIPASARNKQWKTPAMTAAANGHASTLRVLLSSAAAADGVAVRGCGAETSASVAAPSLVHEHKKNAWSPLAYAARGGHVEAIRVLLAHGAPLDDRNKEGATPLYLSCREGQRDAAEVLITAGADVNARSKNQRTPLLAAAAAGHAAVVDLLLRSGADLAASDASGSTLWHECAQGGHAAVFEVAWMAAHSAGQAAMQEARHSRDAAGRTALHAAALQGEARSCRLLLDAGWDADPADGRGATPLYFAATKGVPGCVRVLLDAGADPTRRTSQRSVLGVAAMWGRLRCVELLLEAAAAPAVSHGPRDACSSSSGSSSSIGGAMQRAVGAEVEVDTVGAGSRLARHGDGNSEASPLEASILWKRHEVDVASSRVGAASSSSSQALTAVDCAEEPRAALAQLTTRLAAAVQAHGTAEVVGRMLADADDAGRTPEQVAVAQGHSAVAALLSALDKALKS